MASERGPVMAAPIGPGDWVECLRNGVLTKFRAGSVYCVSAVYPENDCAVCDSRHGGLNIRGMPDPHSLGLNTLNAWPLCVFRPIYPGGELKRLLLEKPVDATPRERVPA